MITKNITKNITKIKMDGDKNGKKTSKIKGYSHFVDGDKKGGEKLAVKNSKKSKKNTQNRTNLAGVPGKKARPLNLQDRVKTLAIKCYDEQVRGSLPALKRRVKGLNKGKYICIGICHDKDNNSDKFWEIAIEKPHYHIIVKLRDSSQHVRVQTILNLLGIVYRPDLDQELWNNHGVELVGDWCVYTLYLLHWTQQAQCDLKHPYKITDLFYNCTKKEVNEFLSVGQQAEKIQITKIAELEQVAYDLGYNLQSWDFWYNNLPNNIRKKKNDLILLREKYNWGVEQRIKLIGEIERICIYIQGPRNAGKTHAITKALNCMGVNNIVDISGQGTGRYDTVDPLTEGIIIDDDRGRYIHQLCNDKPCALYRRNANNPYWCGNWVVATSNEKIENWVSGKDRNSEIFDKDPDETDLAAISRFFVFEVRQIGGVNRIVLTQPATRGNQAKFERKLKIVHKFMQEVNKIMATYNPADYNIDLNKFNYTAAELRQMEKDEIKQKKANEKILKIQKQVQEKEKIEKFEDKFNNKKLWYMD